MQTILSLPVNFSNTNMDLEASFGSLFGTDPIDKQLGSGGGSVWLLSKAIETKKSLNNQKKLIIHSGGQSRRLPAYSACGKCFAPIPVFRWETGQKIDQTLFDIQKDFYSSLLENTSAEQNLMITSGDVLLRCNNIPSKIPAADIVVITTWIEPSIATRHGVLFAKHETPDILDFMLQKPSPEEIENLMSSHLFMMDTGCWILSDKAVRVLQNKCEPIGQKEYNLYSDFGKALGENPKEYDSEISELTCAILNLEEGEFYHYGTTRELISSTEKIQNINCDPRTIQKKAVKYHPSLFVQNCDIQIKWKENNKNIWIENSCINSGWKLDSDTVITNVPQNDWNVYIPKGICIDIVPVDEDSFVLRPYGIDDTFKGSLSDFKTKWMGKSIPSWIKKEDIDIHDAKIFPVLKYEDFNKNAGRILSWMINSSSSEDLFNEYKNHELISASEILSRANVNRLFEQRKLFLKQNLTMLAKNYSKSVFYQSDLSRIKELYNVFDLELPDGIDENNEYITRIRDAALRNNTNKAFEILKDQIVSSIGKVNPVYDLKSDQIVWGRSPVRIDLAGGWSDTPPYSIYNGGTVVNIAVDLNGQQPVQVYVKTIQDKSFVIHSIDSGLTEKIETYEQLLNNIELGSVFSIPKVALALCGFSNEYGLNKYESLKQQLEELGGGLEITLLTAVPKGSGLGTSSILAATLLGTLSNVCCLNWTEHEICYRTLVLEQLIKSGGGWQDQYGAVFGGVKLCSSQSGLQKDISVKKLPVELFDNQEKSGLWLLYYTGVTRVARNILGEIVSDMFLNKHETLQVTNKIKQHGSQLSEAIQYCNYRDVAELIKESWNLNKKLDKGVTTPEIDSIINRIDNYAYGYKLAGAGGGGYMLICAKDLECASIIKKELIQNPINDRARFIDLSLNKKGLVITRS